MIVSPDDIVGPLTAQEPAGPKGCRTHFGNGDCADPLPGDDDADGYHTVDDCNDHNPRVHPGAAEIRCNGVDEDCDGSDLCTPDRDQDGVPQGLDCDDSDPRRNPSAAEIRCNGMDENCDGIDPCDVDEDGDDSPNDCDDRDAARHHDAKEIPCDGVDQNCDGTDCCSNDEDGDGVACRSDCNDRDPLAYPGAPVPPGCYRTDRNCDGVLDGVCPH